MLWRFCLITGTTAWGYVWGYSDLCAHTCVRVGKCVDADNREIWGLFSWYATVRRKHAAQQAEERETPEFNVQCSTEDHLQF